MVVLLLFAAGCGSPPFPTSSVPVAASSPLETAPTAISSPALSPTAPPSIAPTPSRSAGETPTIVSTVDASVRAGPITPALSSVAFANVATGWASGSGIILGTTDSGKSWRPEWSGSLFVSSLTTVDRLHAWGLGYRDPANLGPAADRLVRTSNGGRTWTTTPLAGGFREIAFSTDLTGWAVVGGITDTTQGPGRLERTTDGGLHWHASALAARVDSVCFAGPSVGWAASGSGVYRTLDGGRRWGRVAGGPNDAVNSGWQSTIRCRGSAAWVFWAGGAAAGSEAYRVARTLDGGAHWKTVLSQLDDALASLPWIDSYAGAFAPVSSTAATFLGWCPACGPGTWSSTRTTDGGRTVRHAPLDGLTGASLTEIVFPDAKHGWIAGAAGGGFLLATEDGGLTWHRAYPSAALRPALDIAFISPTVGFGLGVVGDSRAVLRTADGGATWQSIGRLPADPILAELDPILSFVDADHGWVAIVGGVLATRDGGHTWSRVPNTPAGGVAFADALHGCAGSFDVVAMTTDGGVTWVPVDASSGLVACAASLVDPRWATAARPFGPGNLLALDAIVDAKHAWAIGSLDFDRLGLAATTDGGSTWTAYRWPSPPAGTGGLGVDALVRASFVSPTTGWLFTLSGRLFETTDAGATWREITSR